MDLDRFELDNSKSMIISALLITFFSWGKAYSSQSIAFS